MTPYTPSDAERIAKLEAALKRIIAGPTHEEFIQYDNTWEWACDVAHEALGTEDWVTTLGREASARNEKGT